MPRKAKVKIAESIEEVQQKDTVSEPNVVTPKDVAAPKIKKDRKPNKWLLYCEQIKIANPNVSYREILKLAKETYVK